MMLGPVREPRKRCARRRVVGTVLATLLFSGLVAFSKQAQACSPTELEEYRPNPDLADTRPPVLSAADISIRRAEEPGSNSGDCKGNGGYTITVDASDDQTAQDDLGFSLTLVDGSFPFSVPTDDVVDWDGGNLAHSFLDEGEAFDGTLEVRVVDRAGNRSEPKLVSASGDEVGCSCSAAGALSSRYGGVLPLTVLMLLVRRRYSRAAAQS